MEIVQEKKTYLSVIALLFGIASLIIAAVELSLIPLELVNEDFSILFFTSPGDAVFESAYLDHALKAFVNIVIGVVFLIGVPKLLNKTIEGFSFLIGGGLLIFGIGVLFISIWVANFIDTAVISMVEPEVWLEYAIIDGIRVEWFLGIGAISILYVWRNKQNYLK